MKRSVLLAFIFLIAAGVFLFLIWRVFHYPQVQNSLSGMSDSSQSKISAVIVPHFDFVKEKRGGFLAEISQKTAPETIILASVNHYNAGVGEIITSDKQWQLQSGQISPDREVLEKISADKNLLINDENAFSDEHGIKNLLDDISVSFPQAKILPLIIKDTAPKEKIDKLFTVLDRDCSACMLLASIDFSHYCPDSLARIHDQKSLAALTNLDLDGAWAAETDSPQTLYLSLLWAKRKGHSFHLSASGNSGADQNIDSKEVTSYILGSFDSRSSTAYQKTTTFLLGGDLMFDRLVNHRFKDRDFRSIFERMGNRAFWGVDLALANLEGPISDGPISDDVSVDNLTFNFPPETVGALQYLKLNAVSLANNHTLNAGANGLATTQRLLEEANITAIGRQNKFEDSSIGRFESKIPLSVITIDLLDTSADEALAEAIKKEKASGHFVLVFPHWGNEYQSTHSNSQQQLAHRWIDSGADLVVGSHPHVVQDFEIYQGKPIVYSLGNFVFDQTFSEETQRGLLVGGVISEGSLELSFFPTKQVNLYPELARGEERTEIINKLLADQSRFTKLGSDTIKLKR